MVNLSSPQCSVYGQSVVTTVQCLWSICRCHHSAVSMVNLSLPPQCSVYGQSVAATTVQCLWSICRCHHSAVSMVNMSLPPQCSVYGRSVVTTVQCLWPICLWPICRCHHSAVSRADLSEPIFRCHYSVVSMANLSLPSRCSVYGQSVAVLLCFVACRPVMAPVFGLFTPNTVWEVLVACYFA